MSEPTIALVPSAEDLAFVADALLAICGQDAERPYFTEAGFESKTLRHHRRERSVDGAFEIHLVDASESPLLASEVAEVLRRARLTDVQKEIVDLRLLGMTFDEIAARRGTAKQSAQNGFEQAATKMGRAIEAYAFVGIGEAYDRDVARRGHAGRRA